MNDNNNYITQLEAHCGELQDKVTKLTGVIDAMPDEFVPIYAGTANDCGLICNPLLMKAQCGFMHCGISHILPVFSFQHRRFIECRNRLYDANYLRVMEIPDYDCMPICFIRGRKYMVVLYRVMESDTE